MRDPKHPRQFTEELRRQIVALVDSGKPRAEVMREYDLGISIREESCVYAGRRRVANPKVDAVTRCEAPSHWRASTPSAAPHRLS